MSRAYFKLTWDTCILKNWFNDSVTCDEKSHEFFGLANQPVIRNIFPIKFFSSLIFYISTIKSKTKTKICVDFQHFSIFQSKPPILKYWFKMFIIEALPTLHSIYIILTGLKAWLDGKKTILVVESSYVGVRVLNSNMIIRCNYFIRKSWSPVTVRIQTWDKLLLTALFVTFKWIQSISKWTAYAKGDYNNLIDWSKSIGEMDGKLSAKTITKIE